MAKIKIDASKCTQLWGWGGLIDVVLQNVYADFRGTITSFSKSAQGFVIPHFTADANSTVMLPFSPAGMFPVGYFPALPDGSKNPLEGKPSWTGILDGNGKEIKNPGLYGADMYTFFYYLSGQNGYQSVHDIASYQDQCNYIIQFITDRNSYIAYVPPSDLQSFLTFAKDAAAIAAVPFTGGASAALVFTGIVIPGVTSQLDFKQLQTYTAVPATPVTPPGGNTLQIQIPIPVPAAPDPGTNWYIVIGIVIFFTSVYFILK